MRKIFLALLLFALIISPLPFFTVFGGDERTAAGGDGHTLYVGGSGPGNYSSIQAALDHAEDGDTIFVYSGYYKTKDMLSIFKSIRLIGENRETTIIDNNNAPLSINAEGVKIENFTIKNGGIYNNGLQIEYVKNISIHNCIISDSFEGINVEGSSNVEISECLIFNNNMSISISSSSYTSIENCTSYSNENGFGIGSTNSSIKNCSFDGEGVWIASGCGDINMENNFVNGKPLLYYHGKSNFSLNKIEAGEIIAVDCKNFEIKNMNISNTDVGIEIVKGDGITISNCSLHHNNYRGIDAFYISNSRISNCSIYRNGRAGIGISDSINNVVERCNIYKNGEKGVVISDSSFNLISHCNVHDNPLDGISISSILSNERNNISYCNIYRNNNGITIFYSSSNEIYKDNISSNNIGISIWGGGWYNLIKRCDIISNHEGVEIGMYIFEIFLSGVHLSVKDIVYQNNFIGNDVHATFLNVRKIIWDSNYWDDWKGFGRKIVVGHALSFFPVINFDKNPAREPW